MPKVIGFLGSAPVDICLYTAFALQNAGKSVCIIDHSGGHVLYSCIPAPDERLDVITYLEVDFLRREPVVSWHSLDYEYVLVQLGAEPPELCLALCSELVLVIDCERRNMDFYRQFMQDNRLPMKVLVRGFPDGISPKKIKECFACGNCYVEKWMMLPLNEADEAYRLRMQYEPLNGFSHISAGMEKVLRQLLRGLDSGSSAEAARAVKAAKKGRTAGRKYPVYTRTGAQRTFPVPAGAAGFARAVKRGRTAESVQI